MPHRADLTAIPPAAAVLAAVLEDFARAEAAEAAEVPDDPSPVIVRVGDGTEQDCTIHLQAGHLTYLADLIRRDVEERYGYGTAYPAEELPDAEPYEVAGAPDDIGGFDHEGNLR